MELIYTTRTEGFKKGAHYRNPRYFDRPEKGVDSVVIEGSFPAVKDAYEKQKVKVSVIENEKPKAQPKAASKE